MLSLNDFLIGGLLPAAVAALALWSTWRVTGNATFAWLAGFVLGYLSGHWGLDMRGESFAEAVGTLGQAVQKTFRPHEARDWLPWLVVVLAVPEIAAQLGKQGRVVSWFLQFAACAFLPWRLLSLHKDYPTSELVKAGFNESPWSWTDVIAMIAGTVVIGMVLWRASLAAKDQPLPVLRSTLVMFVAVGTAAMLALSGSLTMGQLLGVVAAAVGGCGMATLISKIGRGPEAAPGPMLAAIGGLLWLAYLFIDEGVSPARAALVVVSLGAALTALPRTERMSVGWQIGLRSLLCLVPLVAAVVLAGQDFAATQAAPESSPEEVNPYLNWQPESN